MVPAVVITPLDFLSKASFDPAPVALISLSIAWYLWSVRRLAARGRAWPVGRTASFLFAQVLLAVAVISGLASYDDTNFTIHTIQHILIGMLAPIFLALSAPVTLALQASNRPVQTTILKVLHSRAARFLSHPGVTWPLYGVTLFGLYFTSLYAYSLDHTLVHQLIHLHLLLVGCLFFWPAIGIDPLPRPLPHGLRMLYLMLSLPFHTILGMALESQTTPIAPGISLTDLHTGGGLMWVAGETTGLLCTLAIFVSWLRTDERAAKRTDRVGEAAAAAQLAHWRATREAAARATRAVEFTWSTTSWPPATGSSRSSAPRLSTGPTPCPAWPAGRYCSSPNNASAPAPSRSAGPTTTSPSSRRGWPWWPPPPATTPKEWRWPRR